MEKYLQNCAHCATETAAFTKLLGGDLRTIRSQPSHAVAPVYTFEWTKIACDEMSSDRAILVTWTQRRCSVTPNILSSKSNTSYWLYHGYIFIFSFANSRFGLNAFICSRNVFVLRVMAKQSVGACLSVTSANWVRDQNQQISLWGFDLLPNNKHLTACQVNVKPQAEY